MKFKGAIIRQIESCLYQSLDYAMLNRLSRTVMPGYSLHQATGIPDNIPITVQMATHQFVGDTIAAGRFLPLIENLVTMDLNGIMGRDFPIHGLEDLMKFIAAEGYVYDRTTNLLLENARGGITPNWGRLFEGEEHQFALLRLDIVRSSDLVKENSKEKVEQALGELRAIVHRSVVSRLGRVWLWEGDGCLCGFLLNRKERAAILAGMEIMHELWFWNLLSNPLYAPIQVRSACHTGPVRYSSDPGQLKKNETVREIAEIEGECTAPDFFSTTSNMILSVDRMLQDRFRVEAPGRGQILRQYAISMEEA